MDSHVDERPFVSILIPTCRRNALTLDCIESILANDYSNYEIVVVDQDKGRTLEADIMARFPGEKRIRYHFLNIQALYAARNYGISNSTGRIIIFADDDIRVDPGWVRAYVEAFRSVLPPPAVVGGRIDPLWLDGRPDWLPVEKEYLLGLYPQDYPLGPMRDDDLPIGANFATLRQFCTKEEAFDARLGYSYARKNSLMAGEDSLFSLDLRRKGHQIYYAPAARVWHKISGRKLNRRYMMRRNLSEGLTYITVQHISGVITKDQCLGIIRWHAASILARPFTVARRWLTAADREPLSRMVASLLFAWSYSVGIIRAAYRLHKHGTLP